MYRGGNGRGGLYAEGGLQTVINITDWLVDMKQGSLGGVVKGRRRKISLSEHNVDIKSCRAKVKTEGERNFDWGGGGRNEVKFSG